MNLIRSLMVAGNLLTGALLHAQTTPVPATDSLIISTEQGDGNFNKVDIDASFSGGEESWLQFMAQNLRSDVPVVKGAPAGKYTVVIQFVVGKDGQVTDIKPLTNFGYGMEAEVVRVIKRSPKWTPASQNGKAVIAYRKQPITFVVEEEKKKKKLF